MRAFYRHNALYWLEEYRFDGLRFDAVHAILDPSDTHFLVELARTVRAQVPREVHLVLENEHNQAAFLRHDQRPAGGCTTPSGTTTCTMPPTRSSPARPAATTPTSPTIRSERLRRALAEGFVYQGEPSAHRDGEPRGEPSADLPPLAFVGFLQNHDQIGNRALGERLTELAAPEAVAACQAVLLLCPQVPLLFMGEEWGATHPVPLFLRLPWRAGAVDPRRPPARVRGPVRPRRGRTGPPGGGDLRRLPARLERARAAAPCRLPRADADPPAAAPARDRAPPRPADGCGWSANGPSARTASRSTGGWPTDRCSSLHANLGPAPLEGSDPPAGPILYATHARQPGTLAPWSVTWKLRQDA